VLLHPRIDIGKGADRPGNLPVGNGLHRSLHAAQVAAHFIVPESHLDAESHGFRMDAVGPPDHSRVLVLESPSLQGFHEPLHPLQYPEPAFPEQHGQRRVQHIGRGHADMHKTRVVTDIVGNGSEKGNHVILYHFFYFIDPGHV